MSYEIIFSKGATKQLSKLPQKIQDRIQSKIDDLAIEPRPDGVKKLANDDLYRIRVGNYRVIYKIQDDILLVSLESGIAGKFTEMKANYIMQYWVRAKISLYKTVCVDTISQI